MDDLYRHQLLESVQHLAKYGVAFESGLTDAEIAHVEDRYGLTFPPDLRWFLQEGLPVYPRFPNWRQLDERITEQLAWPLEGICFDIRNRVFWWNEWGARPDSDNAAVDLAVNMISKLPKLVPICGHSYLPSYPSVSGNPVFSIYQADVIHLGANLAEYLVQMFIDKFEFDECQELAFSARYPTFSEEYTPIKFWTDLARLNYC